MIVHYAKETPWTTARELAAARACEFPPVLIDVRREEAFLADTALADPALVRLAHIVRGADTGQPHLAPEAAGLLAVSSSLGRVYRDDHELPARGMVLYDALYAWCRSARSP